MIRITLHGPQGQEISGAIRANRGRLRSDWLPDVMRTAGRYLREVVMTRQFSSEGTYLGAGWEPVTTIYQQWKEDMFGESRLGHRTLALRDAMTSESLEPFTRASYKSMSDVPSTVYGMPILRWNAESVTVGASVIEGGEEYSTSYDRSHGPVFGDGRVPAEVAGELGKLMSMAYMASVHIGMGTLTPRHTGFPGAEITAKIASQALREVLV